jgi:hypothetical protein
VAKHTPTWYLIYETIEVTYPDMTRDQRVTLATRIETSLLLKEVPQ